VFELDHIDERMIGALMMHFFLETVLAAGLLGIDPFDQPAVELGKQIAMQRLARTG
jgi:glucose-6-phosphate isomerase